MLTDAAGFMAVLTIYDGDGKPMGYARGLCLSVKVVNDNEVLGTAFYDVDDIRVRAQSMRARIELASVEMYDGAPPPDSGQKRPDAPPISFERVRRIARMDEAL